MNKTISIDMIDLKFFGLILYIAKVVHIAENMNFKPSPDRSYCIDEPLNLLSINSNGKYLDDIKIIKNSISPKIRPLLIEVFIFLEKKSIVISGRLAQCVVIAPQI